MAQAPIFISAYAPPRVRAPEAADRRASAFNRGYAQARGARTRGLLSVYILLISCIFIYETLINTLFILV